MKDWEVIVRVGAELGDEDDGAVLEDPTLYGSRTDIGWIFSWRVVDQTPILEDRAGMDVTSGTVASWPEALGLLDRYPWQALYPLEVHPEFRAEVMAAVTDRFDRNPTMKEHRLEKWQRACSSDAW